MEKMSICTRLQYLAEQLKMLRASNIEDVDAVMKYCLVHETDISTIMDQVIGGISECLHRDISEEEYRKNLDALIEKLVGHDKNNQI